jgi:hypothetical protein
MDPASATRRTPRRSRLRRLALLAVSLGSWVVLTAPPARADCPLLDLGCVVDTVEDAVDTLEETVDQVVDAVEETAGGVVDTVDETVDGVVDTVDETVDGVVDTVDETVDGVVDTVDETVDGVVDTVEETVDGVGDAVEEVVDPTGDDGGGGRPDDEGSPESAAPAADDPTEPGAPADPESRAGGSAPGSGPTDPPGGRVEDEPAATTPGAAATEGSLAAPAPIPAGSAIAEASARTILGGLGDRDRSPLGFANAVKSFVFPVALGLALAAFLLTQNRLDRRAPKLALAPGEPDVVGFS